MEELEKMSLVELRVAGRKLGMKNVTTFKKKELLEEIQKLQAAVPEAKKTGRKTPARKADAKDLAETAAKEKRETVRKSEVPVEGPVEVSREMSTEKKQHTEEHTRETYRRSFEPEERREGQRTYYNNRNGNRNTRGTRNNHTYNTERRTDNRYDNRESKRADNREDRRADTWEDRRTDSREEKKTDNREERKTDLREDRGMDSRESHTSHRENFRGDAATMAPTELLQLDSGETKAGILEVMPEGYAFIRCDNYLPGEADVYVSPAMIRKFGLRTGDILVGNTRIKNQNEKFSALLYIKTINGYTLEETAKRTRFEHLTPIFPNERIHLEVRGASNNISMRMMDLISPIGKGQRGMIVSQPKTGKTTLLKQVAKSVKKNHPKMHLIVLLIDERPEEVTDIKESIQGPNVEVIYSTFDELPENHKRVSEMVIERAKRLVEHGEDVMILLDSITRLARAYNLTVQPSGRTLSGGLDPAALHMPKRFFGAARNMREGGSLTILATALVDTGSKMDDVVFEEFKGTGNMEMVLDRSLSEKRLFPAIDLPKSSTRRDDLLLTQEEAEANFLIRKAFSGSKSEEAVEKIIQMFRKTKDNQELIQMVKKVKII